ncbi:hypothetical protein JOB18_030282 [Solea senegalensis]|uniref:Uncharacterized protein n=1 Tax=Solea senegalensis TaxID=28829 RepID=A0AAV6SN40_SOLSE|nr:hypothetical protein JOB18_030282 [Solea senegalensis]
MSGAAGEQAEREKINDWTTTAVKTEEEKVRFIANNETTGPFLFGPGFTFNSVFNLDLDNIPEGSGAPGALV